MDDAFIKAGLYRSLPLTATGCLLPRLCVEELALADILQECLCRKAAPADELGISLQFKEGGAPSLLRGDRKLLVTALAHVLDNAIRYNRPGGKVILRHQSEPGGWAVTVSDSGVGIPPQDLDKVFDPFFRTSRAVALAPEGEGLGLCVAREVVEQHGGWIHIGSCEGRGTIVSIYLPSSQA
jgi:two-component system cell cycle sensor histidine kinase PleC